MNKASKTTKVVAISAAIIYGVFLFVFAVGIAGAGHGWGGALHGGFIAIFTTPIIARSLFTVPLKRLRSSLIIFLILVLFDVLFLYVAYEYHTFFVRTRDAALLWLALFSLPQILLLVVFLLDKHRLHLTWSDVLRGDSSRAEA